MAIDTANACMSTRLVGCKFRIHHVTSLTAKFDRLGIFISPVASKRRGEQQYDGQKDKCDKHSSPPRSGQIQKRVRGDLFDGFPSPAPLFKEYAANDDKHA